MLRKGYELHGSMIAFPNHTENGTVESVRYIQALTFEEPS